MAETAANARSYCSECGEPLAFVAEIPEFGMREHLSVFKCTACARIVVAREEKLQRRLQPDGRSN